MRMKYVDKWGPSIKPSDDSGFKMDLIYIMFPLQVPRTKPSSESIEEKHKCVVFAGRITKKKM